MHLNLSSPTYDDGVIVTTHGGVLESENMRNQAQNITYTKKKLPNGKLKWHVKASKDHHVKYFQKNFVGESLEYNFETKSGEITQANTQINAWYLSGEKIELTPTGTYKVKNVSLTTCEGPNSLWKIGLHDAQIENHNLVSAHNAFVKIGKVPVFWLPYFRAKLTTLKEIPAFYKFNSGGGAGWRLGLRYNVYSWRRLNVFWQFDYWFRRGPTTSLQFDYKALEHPTTFKANNFVAWNYRNSAPYNIYRNRVTGECKSKIFDRITIDAKYEKLSDEGVIDSYFNKNYFLQTERRTQLEAKMKADYWLGYLRSTIRINKFDTVSQELPILFLNLKPLNVFNSPLILDGTLNAGYLDYIFSDGPTRLFQNYRSPRLELKPRLYLPINLGPLHITPKAEYIAIGYGQSRLSHPVWNNIVNLETEINIRASKYLNQNLKHSVEPYVHYKFLSKPNINFNDHYFFDYQDAYSLLNQLRFGVKQSLFRKSNSKLTLPLSVDVYSQFFFNQGQIGSEIPKMYIDLSSRFSSFYTSICFGQNFQHSQIDYFNARSAMSFSEDFALSVSFMYRSRFHYRKADYNSYLLDVFRSQADLLASPLSDRRNVLQAKIYWRALRDLIIEFESRSGWNRRNLPAYNEYWIHLTFLLPCNWRFTVTPYKTVSDGWQILWKIQLGGAPPKEKVKPYIYW